MQGGKQSDLVAHIEEAADYDGLAVVWGIKNTKKTAEECAEHCKRHMPKQVAGEKAGSGWCVTLWSERSCSVEGREGVAHHAVR
jgi:hypothetical protein